MSGSTIGGVVGGAVGFFFFGGNWQAGYAIGSVIGGAIKPDVYQGPRLTDAQTQTSTEGVPRPIIYGCAVVAGNLMQSGPLIERKKRERAGKGGPVQESFIYLRTYAIRISEAAPLGGENRLRRAWRDGKLVYSAVPGDNLDADSRAIGSKLTFYSGSETQLPDPTLEALPTANGGGAGNVPAYRGTCYAVIALDDVTDRGGTVPQWRWEIASEATVGASTLELDALSYAADVLPWAENAALQRDPRKAGVEYEYGYIVLGLGYETATFGFGSPEEAVSAAVEANLTQGHRYASLTLRGWTQWDTIDIDTWEGGENIHPWNGASTDANQFQTLGLIYSRYPAETEYASFVMDQAAITGAQFSDGVWVYDPSGNQAGGKFSGVFVWQPTLDAGVDDGFANWNGDDGISGGPDAIRWYADLCVLCRPVKQCIESPDPDWVELPDQPGFYVDPDGAIQSTSLCEEITGSFKQLAVEEIVLSTDPTFVTIPQGPILEVGDADDTEAFWEAAYDAAVLAGTMPAGMTYQANGLGDETTYPRAVTDACQCQPASIPEVAPTAVQLGDIVADACDRVGVGAAQVDVAALTTPVRGFVVGRQMPCAEAVRVLQVGFRFDYPEWDLQLHGVPRGGPVLWTITDDDLVLADDEEDTRAQAVEFPRKVHVIAPDPDAGYEPAKQTAERTSTNVRAVGEQIFELPIVFTRDEGAEVAEIMSKVLWERAAGRWKRELPAEFSGICASDVIQHNGRRYIVEQTETLDMTIKVEAVRDRASAYSSNATGTVGVSPTAPVSSMRGPTMFVAMNLPSLRTADNVPGMYVAATGRLAGWAGADIYLSVDGGLTEQVVTRITSPADMGVLTANVTASGEPIEVRMWSGEPESVTADQLALRANAFAIQGPNRVAEIGQFQTATDVGVADYELTDVTRGQLGTTAVGHESGDVFVMLADAVFVPIDVSLAGRSLIFRAVSLGTAPENNATFSIVYNPQFTAQTVDFYTNASGQRYTNLAGEPYYRIN